MKDGDLIKIHEFETSSEAWAFMVKTDKKKNRRCAIPRENTRFVEEYFHDKEVCKPEKGYIPPRVSIIKDTFDTIHGIKNMADGKQYDSKAAYYKAVKDAGCVVVGDDPAASRQRKEKELDVNWHQEVKRTIDTLSSKKKGKRK